jgi:ABC-type nitrate/sulfonate/bicarbonate transport system substrate-binding protein
MRLVFFVGLILAPGLFPQESHAAAEKKLARLTFSSGWDALPALVALERGFFDQEQLVVSGLTVSSAAAVMRSVASRTTDFASVPQRMLLIMVALKLPIKAISMNGWGKKMELVVPKEDTKTKSISDLKGKTIAMTNGSEVLPALIRLINKERLHPTEIKVKYLPAEKLTKAFKDKLADAVFESKHFTSPLVQGGGGRLVIGHQEIVNSLGFIGGAPLITSKAMVEKEPETVQKFVNAWVKALFYIQQDPKDAARLLQIFFHRQGVPVSKKLAASWVGMTRYDRYIWSPADIADAEYNGWGLKESGVLKIIPKIGEYTDNRFALRALEKIKKAQSRKR